MAIRYSVLTTYYKCPYCGMKYDYTSQKFGGFGNGRDHMFKYYLDSPIKKCKKCGSKKYKHPKFKMSINSYKIISK